MWVISDVYNIDVGPIPDNYVKQMGLLARARLDKMKNFNNDSNNTDRIADKVAADSGLIIDILVFLPKLKSTS